MRRIGFDDQQHHACQIAVRDEGLGTVDDVIVTATLGAGAYALQVRAAAGLGHGDRTNEFAAGEFRQIGALLFRCAVMNKILRDDAVDGRGHAGQAAASHLVVEQCFVSKVTTTPAKFLGYVDAQQTEFAGTPPDRMTHMALLARGFVLRRDFIVEKAGDVIAEQIKLFIHPRRTEINRHRHLDAGYGDRFRNGEIPVDVFPEMR